MNIEAVIDWGIGGITLLRRLLAVSPNTKFLYISDTGFTPYGKVSKKGLLKRLGYWTGYLSKLHISKLHLGCNAISTVIGDMPFLMINEVELVGIIHPVIQYIKKTRPVTVGIVGGNRTVQSRIFYKSLTGSGIKVLSHSLQPLSGLIEKGEGRSETAIKLIQNSKKHLKQIDILVLACTHYETLTDVFEEIFPKVEIILPSIIAAGNRTNDSSNRIDLVTTGDPKLSTRVLRQLYPPLRKKVFRTVCP